MSASGPRLTPSRSSVHVAPKAARRYRWPTFFWSHGLAPSGVYRSHARRGSIVLAIPQPSRVLLPGRPGGVEPELVRRIGRLDPDRTEFLQVVEQGFGLPAGLADANG